MFIAKQTNQSATTLSRKPSVLTAMKLLLNLETTINLSHHVESDRIKLYEFFLGGMMYVYPNNQQNNQNSIILLQSYNA